MVGLFNIKIMTHVHTMDHMILEATGHNHPTDGGAQKETYSETDGETVTYFLNTFKCHLPIYLILASDTPNAAACVAAPILKQ